MWDVGCEMWDVVFFTDKISCKYKMDKLLASQFTWQEFFSIALALSNSFK